MEKSIIGFTLESSGLQILKISGTDLYVICNEDSTYPILDNQDILNGIEEGTRILAPYINAFDDAVCKIVNREQNE